MDQEQDRVCMNLRPLKLCPVLAEPLTSDRKLLRLLY